MSKKIVIGVELIERKSSGVEISAVKLSDEAKRGLSTRGAEISLPPETAKKSSYS
jgi:hypothetical protein